MNPIISLIVTFLNFYNFILLARVLLSWFNLDTSNPTIQGIVRFIHDVTEPVLQPVRQALPAMGGLDLSPLVVFFGIQILAQLIAGLG